MAMTGTGMGSAIKTAIQNIDGIRIIDGPELERFCDAIGTAIVTYIQTTAVVLPDTLNNPIGQEVTVDGKVGSTTAPELIEGTGKVQ